MKLVGDAGWKGAMRKAAIERPQSLGWSSGSITFRIIDGSNDPEVELWDGERYVASYKASTLMSVDVDRGLMIQGGGRPTTLAGDDVIHLQFQMDQIIPYSVVFPAVGQER